MKYQTDEGVNATEKIEKGETKAFPLEDRQAAEDYARQKRSYIYELYAVPKKGKTYLWGYGVPN